MKKNKNLNKNNSNKNKFNFDYFKIINELPLLLKTNLIKTNKKIKLNEDRELIVNPAIIGDFIVSLPAISSYIKKEKEKRKVKFDIIVSPLLEKLAKRIKGIENVYISKSIFSRKNESKKNKTNKINQKYSKIIILRISNETYSLIKSIQTKEIKSVFLNTFKYSFHLGKNLLFKKKPKQWREINFEFFNLKYEKISFEEIFNFKLNDYEKIKKMPILKTKSKIILIHTGSTWWANIWKNENWIELLIKINKLDNFKFIFIGGGNIEKTHFNYIQKKLDFKIYSLIERIDICSLLLLMRISNFFIGIDSGPRNMANLANLKSINIFGPGPHMFMPENPKDIIIDKSKGKGLYERFFYKKSGGYIDKIKPKEIYLNFKKMIKEN